MAKNHNKTDFSFLFDNEMQMFEAFEFDYDFCTDTETSLQKEDYLTREERLITLARDKYERVLGSISLTDAEERLYAYVPCEDDKMGDLLQGISRKVTRPLLRSMQDFEDEYAQMLLSLVKVDGIKVSFVADSEISDRTKLRLRARCCTKSADDERVLGVKIEEEGFKTAIVYGMQSLPDADKSYYYGDGTKCVDMSYFFASLIIYAQVENTLSKYRNRKEQNETYSALCSVIQNFQREYMLRKIKYASSENIPDFTTMDFDEFTKIPLYLPEQKRIGEYCENFISRNYNRLPNCRMTTVMEMAEDGKISGYFSPRSSSSREIMACCMLRERVPFHAFINQSDSIPDTFLYVFCGVSKRRRYMEPELSTFLKALYQIVAKARNEEYEVVSYYKELASVYAKSFMTKSNISGKYLKAMESSLFNKYFGFVEFDTDTDLQKVEEIAKEFDAVKELFLTEVNSSVNAIRFRKLGQHKALGLYYPSVACLCVDIRSPESLIHEYGHLIDYTYGVLSRNLAFSEIRSLYQDYLLSYMKEDKAFNERMNGKTKYNLGYYLKGTEVFARCFELYISKCKNVRNSIVPTTFSDAVYPQDPPFLDKIEKYFDMILPSLKIGSVSASGYGVAANTKH